MHFPSTNKLIPQGWEKQPRFWAVPQLLWQLCCAVTQEGMSLLWHVQNPLVVFFSNPISIIPEPFWLCSKYGVLYPTYHKMQVLCYLVGIALAIPKWGALDTAKWRKFFQISSTTVCSFTGSALWDLPPAFRFLMLQSQWWLTCYIKLSIWDFFLPCAPFAFLT